jgi:hypothetical protein
MEFEARVVGKGRADPNKWVVVDHQRVKGADYSGRKLDKFCSIGSRFESCHFDKVRIVDASFAEGRETSEYVDCSFDGARMTMGPGGYARFVRCRFCGVDMRDWFCFAVELVDCIFSGSLRGSYFNGTVPEEKRQYAGRVQNEFHGNDFSGMEFVDVGFRSGIDLTKQRLPSGPGYVYIPDAGMALQRARLTVIHWEDVERRRLALVEIKILEQNVAAGQRQLFLRPADSYPALGKEVVDSVVSVLMSE